MKLKNLIIFGLVMLFMCGLVSASTANFSRPVYGQYFWNFSGVNSIWLAKTGSNDGASSSASYPSFLVSGSSETDSFSFDGAGDSFDTGFLSVKNTPFTIAMWINPDTACAGTDFIASSNAGTSANSGFSITYVCATEKVNFAITNGLGVNIVSLKQNTTTPKNAWSLIIAEWTGTTAALGAKLTINNMLVNQTTASGTESDAIISNYFIGDYALASVDGLKGLIDNVMFFNKTLNVTEKSNIYKYGSPVLVPVYRLPITAVDLFNSSAINKFSIKVQNGTTIKYNYTSTGTINQIYNNDTRYYNITFFNATNYANRTYENYNFSASGNLEGELIFANSVTVNIYDRATGNPLTENVSLYFLTLFNDTTSTGTYYKTNPFTSTGTFTVQALSTGYGTEQYTFDYTGTNITINFYLLNLTNANAGNLFVNSLTTFYTPIASATVKLYEYSPTELSFIQVSQCLSNSNGECGFNIELNTKTYYITSNKYIDGNLYFDDTNDEGEIILTDNEVRDLILYYTDDFTILDTDDLIYSITETFIANVSNILVSFMSISGNSLDMCVDYYLMSGISKTLANQDCLTTSSALQNINANYLLNRSNTYKAEVYLNQTSGKLILATFNYPDYERDIEEFFDEAFIGVIILLFWSGSLALCLYLKNITLFGIIALFLCWIEVALFPSFSIVAISVFRTIISILIIYISRKIQDTE